MNCRVSVKKCESGQKVSPTTTKLSIFLKENKVSQRHPGSPKETQDNVSVSAESPAESSRKTSAELMFKIGWLGRTQCFQREAVRASVKDWAERTDRTTVCLPPAGYKGWGKPKGKELQLNSAGHRPSRTGFGQPCFSVLTLEKSF